MSDLVDRLRRQMSPKTYIGEPLLTFTDLIDEIERLTADFQAADDKYLRACGECAHLTAENAALRAALNAIANTPRMLLFPDPNAHSREAYLTAVFRAWSTANQIARTALEKP